MHRNVVVQAKTDFSGTAEEQRQVAGLRVAEAHGVGNEVEHPVAENRETHDHTGVGVAENANRKQSCEYRPNEGHEEAVRPVNLFLDSLHAHKGEDAEEKIEGQGRRQEEPEGDFKDLAANPTARFQRGSSQLRESMVRRAGSCR